MQLLWKGCRVPWGRAGGPGRALRGVRPPDWGLCPPLWPKPQRDVKNFSAAGRGGLPAGRRGSWGGPSRSRQEAEHSGRKERAGGSPGAALRARNSKKSSCVMMMVDALESCV